MVSQNVCIYYNPHSAFKQWSLQKERLIADFKALNILIIAGFSLQKNFWLGIITEDKCEKLYSKKTKGMCTCMSKTNKRGSAIALLPIGVFLLIFIGSGVLTGDFYSMPAIVGFLIALIVAFAQNKKLSFIQKLRLCSTACSWHNRRKGRSETPAIGAKTVRLGIITFPI